MRTIPLSRGGFALVDDEDFDRLSAYSWYRSEAGYACSRPSRRGALLYMHLLIVGVQPGTEVDHRNRNRLDNRRDNLRHVPQWVNSNNANIASNNRSGYTGVYRRTRGSQQRPWAAQLGFQGKIRYLGSYATPEEASAAVEAMRTERLRAAGYAL